MSIGAESFTPLPKRLSSSLREVPWQIWVVVALLALEGVSNLLALPAMPIATYWLLVKCLFILGLIRRWRWVFVLFLVVTMLHVLAIESLGPAAAFMNLIFVILVASTWRWSFDRQRPRVAVEA